MDDFQDPSPKVAFIQHPLSKVTTKKPGTTNSKSVASNSTPQANLQFIHLNSSTGPTQDDTTKQVVRSHVMRGFQEWKQSKKDEKSREGTAGSKVATREKKDVAMDGYEKARTDVAEKDGATMKRMRVEEIGTTPGNSSDSTSDAKLGNQPFKTRKPLGKSQTRKIRSNSSKKSVPKAKARTQTQQLLGHNTPHDESLTDVQHTNTYSTIDFSLPSPIRTRAIYAPDPFSSTPTLSTPRLQILIHHYNTNMSQTLLPLNPRNKWFSHALSDTALFHGTLLHSSIHQSILSKTSHMEELFAIKRETIAIVNRRMEDERERISDVTIGAVACLALFENQAGNKEVSNIHMDGLQRMVEMRGGLESLDLSGILPRLILWADLTNAVLTLSKPRFPLPTSLSNQHIPPPSSPPPPNTPKTCPCTTHLSHILPTLSTLSTLVSPTNHAGSLSDTIYLIERQLLCLSRSCSPSTTSPTAEDPTHSIDCGRNLPLAISQAGLMYIYLFLRDCLARAPIFEIFLGRLVGALWVDGEYSSRFLRFGASGDGWEGREGVGVWVLVLGALVAVERGRVRDREMFVRGLVNGCGVLGVRSEEGLRGLLYKVAWRDGGGDEELGRLWEEIVAVGEFRWL